MGLQPQPGSAALVGLTVGQYRITELIGAGGMGDVYRARDVDLKRTVAIKALPDRTSTDELARKRFLREARLACRVTHPYTATVLSVIEHEQKILIVMEYIEGRTLSEVLREEKPDLETTSRYAVEIAEALSAIHKAGLVHRDLKPANVMITPDGHVKVMDFGLARTLLPADLDSGEATPSVEPTLTREGVGLGTLLYMSPEQMRGEPVDARSDLFSFGVLLYESLTGVHPFRRKSVAESSAAILNEHPGGGTAPESLSSSALLRETVLKLLEKDPAERYPDVEALIGDLRTAAKEAGGMALPVEQRKHRTLAWLVGGAVLIALAIASFFWWISRPPQWDAPRFAVAVAPFRDETGLADGALKAAMVSDLLTAELESSHLVRAVGPEQTVGLLSGLPGDADPTTIAQRVIAGTSADYVLLGTLYYEDDRYVAKLTFESPDPQTSEMSTIRGEGATAVQLVAGLGANLRKGLPSVSQLNAWRDRRAGTAEITARSEEARLHYERGLLALRDGLLVEAIGHFEAALEIEPDFALGQAKLADTLNAAGYARLAREAAEKAARLAPAPRTRTTKRLALLIRSTRARVFEHAEEMLEVSSELAALFPDEPGILNKHAAALNNSGEYHAALKLIERALELDPVSANLHVRRAEILMHSGSGEQALAALDRAGQLFSAVQSTAGRAEVALVRGQTYFQQQQFAEAKAEFARGIELLPAEGGELRRAELLFESAQIELLEGNAAAAEDSMAEAARLAREVGDLRSLCHALSGQGARRYMMGELATAERMLRESVDLARQLENELLLISPLSNLAGLFSYQGRIDEARTLFEESIGVAERLGLERKRVLALLYLSDIEYKLGNIEQAIRSYSAILEKDDQGELGRLVTWARLGVAEVEERRGRLAEALAHAEQGVRVSRERSFNDLLGYALARRGQLLAALGREGAALQDIDEAEQIASAPQAGLQELLVRCALARAIADGFAGRWQDALSAASQILSAQQDELTELSAAAGALHCEGSLYLGMFGEAIDSCRRVAELERAPLAQRVIAEALLGEAFARAGDGAAASSAALAAFEQAERMQLLLPLAQSAAVLVTLPEDLQPEDSARIGEAGRLALKNYLNAAPQEDRESLLQREDLLYLDSILVGPVSSFERSSIDSVTSS